MSGAVPVIMYHSVGRFLPDWEWSQSLTVPAHIFEDHLRWLARSGYRTAGLDELHDHVSGKGVLPPKTVVLTFDDGYVDNWLYVFPLLAKYDFTGTVLVTPEFVDPRDIVRPTLENVWSGATGEGELDVRGFMSWPELGAASARGVLSAQCHALTHTWYPTGPRVVDFHHPGDAYYWLDWNANPAGKPFYLRDPRASAVGWGTPVYEHAKSLECTRFYPDEGETAHLVAFVTDNGGESFFGRPDWREKLEGELADYRGRGKTAERYETAGERRERYENELQESKQRLEERLGTGVDYFVWPGGGYNDESLEMARSLFKATTVGKAGRDKLRNRPDQDAAAISRRGVPELETAGQTLYPGGRYLVEFLDEFRGSRMARRRRQLLKLLHLGAFRIGLWPRSES